MLLHIQVKPGARKDSITQTTEGIWKIQIRARPIDGEANKYLIGFLADIFKLPKSSITLKKGERSTHKTLEIDADTDFIDRQLLNFATH